MGVSSYFEFVTVLFGWIMYDRIWSVLNQTGLVLAPFVVMVVRNVMESRKGGDDEGSAAVQSLKRNEVDVVVGIVVLAICVVPFTEVRLSEMTYVRPQLDCAVASRIAAGTEPAAVAGTATGTSYDAVLASLGGERGRVPIWWGFVHALSKAVSAAAVAGIPCSADVSGLQARLAGDPVEDGDLLVDLADFSVDCHQKALKCTRNGRGCGLPRNEAAAARAGSGYMGSRYFLTRPGWYDKWQSRNPQPAWPRVESRDGRYRDGGAHPTCRDWWQHPSEGIRARLLDGMDEALREDMLGAMRERFPAGTSEEYLTDRMLAEYLDARGGTGSAAREVFGGAGTTSYAPGVAEAFRSGEDGLRGAVAASGALIANLFSDGLAGLGGVLQLPATAAAGVVMREGMPMFHALLMMVFVAVLPVLLVFSRYEPGTVIVLSLIYFGFQFVYVLWGIAFWVDQRLYEALAGGDFLSMDSPIETAVFLWSQRFLYVAFPMIWMAALGWVGVNAQQAFMSGVQSPTNAGAQIAQTGGDVASRAATGLVGGVARGAVAKIRGGGGS